MYSDGRPDCVGYVVGQAGNQVDRKTNQKHHNLFVAGPTAEDHHGVDEQKNAGHHNIGKPGAVVADGGEYTAVKQATDGKRADKHQHKGAPNRLFQHQSGGEKFQIQF